MLSTQQTRVLTTGSDGCTVDNTCGLTPQSNSHININVFLTSKTRICFWGHLGRIWM